MDLFAALSKLLNTNSTMLERLEAGLGLLQEGLKWWKTQPMAFAACGPCDLDGLCNNVKQTPITMGDVAVGAFPWAALLPLVQAIVEKLFEKWFKGE